MRKLILTCSLGAALAGCSTDSVVTSNSWPTAQVNEVTSYYAIPRAYYMLDISRKDCKVDITIDDKTPVTYLPDPNRRYILKYQPDDWSNDALTLETDAQGLLKSVNGTSENQSSAAASGILDLATRIASAGGGAFFAFEGGKPSTCDPKKDVDVAYSFDPTEPADAEAALKEKLPADLLISVALPTAATDAAKKDAKCPDKLGGACFPPARSYNVEVKAIETIAGTPAAKDKPATEPHAVALTRDFRLVAPDPKQLFYVSLKRRGIAKLDVGLTFEHGMLTKNVGNYASPVLAAVQWPSAVVTSAIGLAKPASSATPPTPAPAPAPAAPAQPATGASPGN